MGWWVVVGVLNISSGPFLSYEIEIGDGPGPELDNSKESKLGPSFIIIKDPTIASC